MAQKKLTAKQELFIKEYLIDLNATQAAIRAGYSENTASEMGYENLNKPQIKEAIGQVLSERHQELEYTGKDVINDLITVKTKCIETDNFQPANKALELLGKYHKLWNDNKEPLSGNIQFTNVNIIGIKS